MKKKYYLIIPIIVLIINKVSAVTTGDFGLGGSDIEELNVHTTTEVKTIVNNIIMLILGFLGLISTVVMLMGGFKWMTSQGNTDKVDEAKKLLKAGIVGLVIIFAAYAITAFVMKTAFNASSEAIA